MKSLEEICIFIRNGLNIKNDKSKKGIPLTRIETISNGIIDINKTGYADIFNEKYSDYYLQKDDILMSHINSLKHLGKVGYCYYDMKIIHGMNLLNIRVNPNNVYPKYLYYYFKSNNFKIKLNKISKQSVNQSSFSISDLKKIRIDIIDLKRQKLIATKLDKVVEVISIREKQIDELNNLIKSQFVEMFGETSEAYKKHRVVKLSEIAEYYNGLTYKPTDVSESGTIVLRSGNIQNSKLEYSDIVRVKCNIKEKQYVKEKDILMCSRNGSEKLVGKVAMIKELEEKMTFGAFMLIIRSKYYTYLFSYFQSDDFRKKIKYGATTTINQITVNMLNKLELPMPDIKLQNEFAEIVKQIDKQKFEIEKSLKETQELYESLMEKYFG